MAVIVSELAMSSQHHGTLKYEDYHRPLGEGVDAAFISINISPAELFVDVL